MQVISLLDDDDTCFHENLIVLCQTCGKSKLYTTRSPAGGSSAHDAKTAVAPPVMLHPCRSHQYLFRGGSSAHDAKTKTEKLEKAGSNKISRRELRRSTTPPDFQPSSVYGRSQRPSAKRSRSAYRQAPVDIFARAPVVDIFDGAPADRHRHRRRSRSKSERK